MGRPKTSDPRTLPLKLNLTIGEFVAVRQRAKALGLRPAHFARNAILNTNPATSETASNHIERLIHDQLRRLGNNLNQLVRHMHQTGDPLPADLEPLLIDIRNLIARVRQ